MPKSTRRRPKKPVTTVWMGPKTGFFTVERRYRNSDGSTGVMRDPYGPGVKVALAAGIALAAYLLLKKD